MIRKLTDPDRFRIPYGANGRRYVDREPADGTWEPTGPKEKLINCTAVAKAVGSDSFWKKVGSSSVPLDALRVADYVIESWAELEKKPVDERREVMAGAAGRDLARAAARGNTAHEFLEGLLDGQEAMFVDPVIASYESILRRVASDFESIIRRTEVVAFNRNDELPYGGTFDAIGDSTIIDWKTRGPDSKHGCYEKEVAQVGLGALCHYHFVEVDGQLVRVPMPTFAEGLVVSIRPDSYEVYPVDIEVAKEVAEQAITLYSLKSTAGSASRRAVGQPRPMPAAPAISTAPPNVKVAPVRVIEAPPKARKLAKPLPKPKPAEWAPDEGRLIDADQGKADLVAVFKLLDVGHSDFNRWVKEAQQTGRRFNFTDKPTHRRYQIYSAGARLYSVSNGDDTVARAYLSHVIGEEVQPAVKVGTALGSLTVDEAMRLAAVCETATLTFSDDGAPTVVAA